MKLSAIALLVVTASALPGFFKSGKSASKTLDLRSPLTVDESEEDAMSDLKDEMSDLKDEKIEQQIVDYDPNTPGPSGSSSSYGVLSLWKAKQDKKVAKQQREQADVARRMELLKSDDYRTFGEDPNQNQPRFQKFLAEFVHCWYSPNADAYFGPTGERVVGDLTKKPVGMTVTQRSDNPLLLTIKWQVNDPALLAQDSTFKARLKVNFWEDSPFIFKQVYLGTPLLSKGSRTMQIELPHYTKPITNEDYRKAASKNTHTHQFILWTNKMKQLASIVLTGENRLKFTFQETDKCVPYRQLIGELFISGLINQALFDYARDNANSALIPIDK